MISGGGEADGVSSCEDQRCRVNFISRLPLSALAPISPCQRRTALRINDTLSGGENMDTSPVRSSDRLAQSRLRARGRPGWKLKTPPRSHHIQAQCPPSTRQALVRPAKARTKAKPISSPPNPPSLPPHHPQHAIGQSPSPTTHASPATLKREVRQLMRSSRPRSNNGPREPRSRHTR